MDATAPPIHPAPRFNPAMAVAVVAGLALVVAVFQRAFAWWYFEWTANGSYYAHAVFIPFFATAMLWRAKDVLARTPIERCWWGLVPLALGLPFVRLGYAGEVTVTLSVAFMLMTFGAALTLLGWKFTRIIAMPMLFLFSIIPIVPNQVINVVAFPVQLKSAQLAATLLNTIGFHAVRNGTSIQMDSYALNVEVACSGFKTLLGLLSFAGAFAYLVEAQLWKRWLLFIISGPLAVLVNGIRIALIGLVGELVSSSAAMVFHDYSGFIVLILGFMFLFSMARWIKCDRLFNIPLRDDLEDVQETEEIRQQRQAELNNRWGPVLRNRWPKMQGGVMPVLAVLMGALVVRTTAQPKISDVPLLQAAQVPRIMQEEAYQQLGEDLPLTPEVKDALDPDIYVDRNYHAVPPKAGTLHLLITGGRSRRTFHDPHECFTGSGYTLHDVRIETIDTPAGPVQMQLSEATNPKDNKKELVMFTYVVDGELVPSMAKVHIANLRRTFFGSSGKPFYFFRVRNLAAGNDEGKLAEMRDFVRSVWPKIGPTMLAAEPTGKSKN
jgi:exosortase